MNAEDLVMSYKNFIEMCVGRDINDAQDIQFLFRLYIEQFNKKDTSSTNKKGCGKRYPMKGSESLFPTIGAVCGDNRLHQEGDELNLCPECEKSTLCEHDWEEHGCTKPLEKYYICKLCGKEKKIYSTKNETENKQ